MEGLSHKEKHKYCKFSFPCDQMYMKNELKIWRIPLSATICESTNQPKTQLTQGYEAPLVTDFFNLERSCKANSWYKGKNHINLDWKANPFI